MYGAVLFYTDLCVYVRINTLVFYKFDYIIIVYTVLHTTCTLYKILYVDPLIKFDKADIILS